MDIKNEVLYRIYFILFGMVIPVSILLVYRTVDISILQGEEFREAGQKEYVKYREVEADRGNILSYDGSLLATSIPYFDLYFDPLAPTQEDFEANLDSLALCLATYVDDTYTPGGYRQWLLELRDSTNRHVLIKRKVSYREKRRIENFPLFRLGQFRGGLIAKRRSERRRPFRLLAQRTIGYVREGAKPVGLEGFYNDVLSGNPGQQLMIKVDPSQDLWMPMEDLTAIDPTSGNDIVTTLDVNLQEIVEEALLRAMNYHEAEWGTAVLMEVKTGAIRAIANLERLRNGEGWWELYNHAIGSGLEPGSTFKLASIMALLEDGYVDLEDTIRIYKGKAQFYEEEMVDSSPESFKTDTTTVRRAFEISSNVGMATMVNDHYGRRTPENDNQGAERFLERLHDFNLHVPTGIEIEGEAAPYLKEAYSEEDQWSGTTLPWMSIGYELELTPLQLLTFYNAVANDGRVMKPYLVTEVQRFGDPLENYKPVVLKNRIAKALTIRQAQELLEGVVERGTAYKLRSDRYRFAGKTGTAQINYRRNSSGRRVGGYQSSFVGYFPAEDPVYSCIVVINRPRKGGIYGAEVAGPVFREIADKCFGSRIELHDPYNAGPKPLLAENMLPNLDAGDPDDLSAVLQQLGVPVSGLPESVLAVTRPRGDTVLLQPRTIRERRVPSVIGLGLRDALYILENLGLQVEVEGYGKVAQQSLKVGTQVQGQSIKITLR